MRKMLMSILLVCLMGISFSVGHLWCEKHGGCCPQSPDKCLVKKCCCESCKCCAACKLGQKCDCKDCACCDCCKKDCCGNCKK